MSVPTCKLKFAYDSIANLEQQIATLRAQLAAAEARAERYRAALRALLESDKDGAIASASDDDLIAAISDASAGDVVRIQAAAVFAARAALSEGEAG